MTTALQPAELSISTATVSRGVSGSSSAWLEYRTRNAGAVGSNPIFQTNRSVSERSKEARCKRAGLVPRWFKSILTDQVSLAWSKG
jgi:hypothetical protein